MSQFTWKTKHLEIRNHGILKSLKFMFKLLLPFVLDWRSSGTRRRKNERENMTAAIGDVDDVDVKKGIT